MHPLFAKANSLTEHIIGGAIEVHKDKGPGLVESIYEWCLVCELELRKLPTTNQKRVNIYYKGFTREEPLRFDILVADCVLVEAKSVGLLINFKESKLTDGISRLILPGANR